MHVEHFSEIDSTQRYLIKNIQSLLQKGPHILVTANVQTAGIGRRGNTWQSLNNALLMSFTLTPNKELTLTPLEVAVLTINFIKKKFNTKLVLKWPNDILTTDKEKCGGIIIEFKNNILLIGLAINLGNHDIATIDYPIGKVTKTTFSSGEINKISEELYQFILKNRLSNIDTIKEWNRYNAHKNLKVKIINDDKEISGIFLGINDKGGALLKDNEGPIYSGSLLVLD